LCGRQRIFVGAWKKGTGFFEKQWGKVKFFMKKLTAEWVRKAEADFEAANTIAKLDPSLRDPLCFHCQQTVEKYLKALLQELGQVVPRTHDLANLLNRLLKLDKTLRGLQRGLKQLTRYAVEYRYPGIVATSRQARSALRRAELVRQAIRIKLGIPASGKRRPSP